MGFAVADLPYVTLWKNLTALEEGYVTGLEPGTGFLYTRRLEREAGRVPKLKPGETRRFAIDVGLHTTAAGARRSTNRSSGSRTAGPHQIDRRRNGNPLSLILDPESVSPSESLSGSESGPLPLRVASYHITPADRPPGPARHRVSGTSGIRLNSTIFGTHAVPTL